MKVEVLYIADCPNHKPTVERVRDVLRSAGMPEMVQGVEVCTQADAEAKRFLGSPTVQVDGLDVEPGARAVRRFGLGAAPMPRMVAARACPQAPSSGVPFRRKQQFPRPPMRRSCAESRPQFLKRERNQAS